MQNVLTQTYCAICDAVESFFKTLVTRKPKTFNRSTYNQLNALTDADLKDIGICRGDIYHIANGGEVYRGKHL